MEIFLNTPAVIKFSLISGFALVLFSILLMLLIIGMHFRLLIRARRQRRFLKLWRPILINAVYEEDTALPALRKRDYLNFIILWNHLQESFSGEVKEKLNDVARRLELFDTVKKMLHKGNTGKKLVALTFFGHLREREVWEEILALADSENITVSLAAASALSRINPKEAASVIISLINKRHEWPAYKVAAILNELGPDFVTDPFAELVMSAKEETIPHLVRYLTFSKSVTARAVVKKLLETTENDNIISACLQLLGHFANAEDLPLIRAYIKHPQWFVRVQAIIALGKTASQADEEFFLQALFDSEWWVRYRAAVALVGLPHQTKERLHEVISGLGDRYGREILTQVAAERQVDLWT